MTGTVLESSVQSQRAPGWRAKGWLLAGLWTAFLLLGFGLDGLVAQRVQESGFPRLAAERDTLLHSTLDVVKFPGTYWAVVVAAIVVALVHPKRLMAAGFVMSAAVPGVLSNVLKWMVGRTRPFKLAPDVPQPEPFYFEPLRGGIAGLFRQTNLAFPSGHTTVAFAAAVALAILFPRQRVLFYGVATLVAMDRVLENAHYLTDTIAAAGLSVLLMRLIWARFFEVSGRSHQLIGSEAGMEYK